MRCTCTTHNRQIVFLAWLWSRNRLAPANKHTLDMISTETAKDDSVRGCLRQQLRNELPRLGWGSAALLVSSLSNQAFPRMMGRLIDNEHSTWTLGMVVLGGGLASLVRTYSLQTAEARIGQRLSDAAVLHVLRYKDLEWFRQPNQESDPVVLVSSILQEDVPKIAKTLTVTVASLARSTSAVVLSSFNMILVSPSLLGVAISVVPLVGAVGMLLRKAVRNMAQADHVLSDTTHSFLQERLRHIDMVRQCDRSNDEISTYKKYQQQRLELLERNSLREGCMMGFLFSATASALMLVVWMGGKAVARGRMTGGQLTSFSTYAFLLGIGTSGLVKAYGEGVAGLVAAERYYSLLVDQESEERALTELQKEDAGKQMEKPQNVQSIEIQDLHFSYKGSSRSCLNGLSFELRRGEVVALVGANGTGKTTVASILCGLFAPTKGSVLVDDPSTGSKIEFADLNRASKQRIVQMIPQSAALFDISIIENVQYGNPTASLLDVRYALSKAKCNDFISRLPDGLNTRIGIDGMKLSGGERQRLALARALLADPPILILDEPATALDAEGFAVISEAVSSGRGRAMLLITHNPRTLEMANRVFVMDQGTLVEKGTFHELRANKKSKLCELMPSLVGK